MEVILGNVFTIENAKDGWYELKESIYYITDEMIDDSFSYIQEKSILNKEMIKDIAEVIKSHNLGVSISENEGKLIIEPLKKEEKEDDLPIDTPCMCRLTSGNHWFLRYYSGECSVFINGCKSKDIESKDRESKSKFAYIIPCDSFNFENPEESLKYNIVK